MAILDYRIRMLLPPRSSRVLCGMPVIAVLIVVWGCSGNSIPQEDEITKDLREIARAYEVAMQPSGTPPRDIEQIQRVLQDLHTDKIVGPPDEILTSSRDGEPYVVILGAKLGDGTTSEILAYEKHGTNGTRYVLLASRDIRVMTNEEFAKAKFVQGHKPELP